MNDVTEQQVWDKLKTVMDPEMGINLVDLGLIYEVRVEGIGDRGEGNYKVFILMTLTSPGCPLAALFDELVGGAVRKIKGVKQVNIEITFDPPWNMDKMSEEARAELGMF